MLLKINLLLNLLSYLKVKSSVWIKWVKFIPELSMLLEDTVDKFQTQEGLMENLLTTSKKEDLSMKQAISDTAIDKSDKIKPFAKYLHIH